MVPSTLPKAIHGYFVLKVKWSINRNIHKHTLVSNFWKVWINLSASSYWANVSENVFCIFPYFITSPYVSEKVYCNCAVKMPVPSLLLLRVLFLLLFTICSPSRPCFDCPLSPCSFPALSFFYVMLSCPVMSCPVQCPSHPSLWHVA